MVTIQLLESLKRMAPFGLVTVRSKGPQARPLHSLPATVISCSRMSFHPYRYGKVNPRLAISSRATCRFQLGADQSVELSFDMSDALNFQLRVFHVC